MFAISSFRATAARPLDALPHGVHRRDRHPVACSTHSTARESILAARLVAHCTNARPFSPQAADLHLAHAVLRRGCSALRSMLDAGVVKFGAWGTATRPAHLIGLARYLAGGPFPPNARRLQTSDIARRLMRGGDCIKMLDWSLRHALGRP